MIRLGRTEAANVGKIPSRNVPLRAPAMSSRSLRKPTSWAWMASALATMARPASVSETPRGWRSRTVAWTSDSSLRTCWEMAEGVYASSAAAPVIVPCRAMAASTSSLPMSRSIPRSLASLMPVYRILRWSSIMPNGTVATTEHPRPREAHVTPAQLDLVVIPGDGIGPELVDSALEVLHAALAVDGIDVQVETILGGAGEYARTGRAFDTGLLGRLRSADGVLKGPVGLPEVRKPDGTEAGLLGGILRTGLDTFANVRPMSLQPGMTGATRHDPDEIDYVIVRENTEGLYLSRGNGVATRDAATDQLMITRAGVERVARFAFDLAATRSGAPADGVRRVTCVDKSNVLRSFALFREVFTEVSSRYPEIEADYLYADAAAHELVVHPERFDVLVMENFLGDVLSDLGAGTVGGLGMCPSGNIGAEAAYFEPIHGSAPTLAGTDRANPLSQVLSAGMLLDHAGHPDPATRIRRAVGATLADGSTVIRSDGTPGYGTRAVTAAIVQHIDTSSRARPAAAVSR